MAEATGLRNNALPYPIYGQPWGIVFPLLDADGDPISPSSPDSEISKNGDTFADCTNEATEIATTSGSCYLLLTATEMTADVIVVQCKSTGAKTTVITLYPRKLVSFRTGTSQTGAAGTITLDSGASAVDDFYNGCVCAAVLDTLNEVRMITDYVGSTKVASVTPNWNTTPDSDDTFTIYLPEGRQITGSDQISWLGTTVATPATAGIPDVNVKNIDNDAASASGTVTFPAGTVASTTNITAGTITTATNVTTVNGLASGVITAASIAADAITAAKVADGTIDAATFAAGAINAAAIAADAITDAKVASDVTIASVTGSVGSVTGAVGSVTGNVGGNVTGSVGSVASGGITATSIAADAIGASELAADAVAEIADAVWDEVASGHLTVGTFGQRNNPVRASTATGGSSTTITLDASASATDDIYNYDLIVITAGTGAGQARYITDYVGSTKIATVATWQTNPSSDSVFYIVPGGQIPGATAPTAADVADAVWDEATAGHTTSGTFGEQLKTDVDAILDDTGTSGVIVASLASGAITATSIAADAIGASELAADAATEIATAVWALGTRSLTVLDEDTTTLDLDATIRAAVGMASANLDTQLTTIDDFLDTEVAAIKAKTDQFVFTTANRVDSQVFGMQADTVTASAIATDAIGSAELAASAVTEIQAGLSTLDAAGVRSAVGLASANLDTQLDALPTAIENADALLNRDMSTGTDSGSTTVRTVRQALRFLRNKWSISSTTLTVTKEDDSTASWTTTLTATPGADPVTGSDPAGP